MRESCSCGAFIQTARYRRVKDWRGSHRHDTAAEPDVEPDKQGGFAIVERANQHDYDGERPATARIGFTPNQEA